MLDAEASGLRRGEYLAEHDDLRRIPRLGVPLGGRLLASRLNDAIRRLMADAHAADGPRIEFCSDSDISGLRPELQSAVLAIAYELLLNACRHSRSRKVLLGFGQDEDEMYLQVQDWGIGFAPESTDPCKGGLRGIRNLVAWLGGMMEIDSQPGMGTCAVVEVPLPRPAEWDSADNVQRPAGGQNTSQGGIAEVQERGKKERPC